MAILQGHSHSTAASVVHRPDSVTDLLNLWSGGEREAAESVFDALYDQLRRIARRGFSGERAGHTLQPTALVHEAFLRLSLNPPTKPWQSREHFLALAACMVRRILVDHARRRGVQKRGGGAPHLPLDELGDRPELRPRELLALDGALDDLQRLDPRKALVVELRFFGGLTMDEIGEVLGTSPRTAHRDWDLARVLLVDLLGPDQASP